MSKQPACGCPVPVINPPDLGMAERAAGECSSFPAPVPLPADPSGRFPRALDRQRRYAAIHIAGDGTRRRLRLPQ